MLKDEVKNKWDFEDRIFNVSREYFKGMLNINKDASKDIVNAIGKGEFEKAEGIFIEVLRSWWQSYENKGETPYEEIFKELELNLKEGYVQGFPVRPTVSGFLTELFVIEVIKQLTSGNGYRYVHSKKVSPLDYAADLSVWLDNELKFVVEVKTTIPTGKKKLKDHHDNIDKPYFLICADGGKLHGMKTLPEDLNDTKEPFWIYLPREDTNEKYERVKRFKSIVEQIREI